MNSKKRITFIGALFVVAIAMIASLNFNQTNVKAWSSIDSDVIKAAPYGLPLNTYFNIPQTFSTGETNSATTSSPSGDTNNPNVVLLTKGKGQTSAVWSKGDNYIDIYKKQNLSMWLYFGRNADPKGAADGMAFVLQNDSDHAISTLNGKVNKGESLGVWGSDSSPHVTNNDEPLKGDSTTPIQKQAIQKSWALEFDTYANKGTGIKDSDGNQIHYDAQNKPTTMAQIPKPGDAFDWLPYSGDNNFIIGSHIAWNYPARSTSYQQISPLAPKSTDVKDFFGNVITTNVTGTSVMALNHHFSTDSGYNGNNIDFTYNSSKPAGESWKHVSIEYTPPTAADPNTASIHYKYDDKNINGKIIKKHLINTYAEGTAPIDLTAFGDVKDGQLRYGFTGSTGDDTDTTSAVVFETMPSLVEAETNSYAVDEDTHARVGSDTSIMDKDAQAMSETTKVHPGDNIGLNYMMQYDSGKQPAKGLVSTIDLPDNLTIKNDSGNIGTIYYTSADGKSTKDVAVNASSISSDGKSVSVNLEDMGVADGSNTNWKTARVELNTIANPLTSDASLTVPAGHAVFEGTNYKSDTEIPTFDIVKPADTLVLAKTSGDGSYSSTTKEIDLNGSIKYGTSTADVDKSATWYTYKIDGQPAVTTQDTLTKDTGKFSIPITGLTDGDHKITVKASSTLSNDVISSNEITYNVTVTSKQLIITPDDQNRTVDDDGIQTFTGTLKFSDGSRIGIDNIGSIGQLTDGKGNLQASTEMNGSKASYDWTDDSRTVLKYTFKLRPVGYSEQGAIDQNATTGLTVGENNYKVIFSALSYDSPTDTTGHGYKSTVNYKVNVPDLKINISNAGQDKITTLKGQDLKLPSTLNYSDPDHKYSPRYMTAYGTVDNLFAGMNISTDFNDTSNITGEYKIPTGLNTPSGLDTSKTNFEAEYYVLDPYLRKSNTIKYDVDVVQNYVKLTTNKNYSFGSHSVDPQIDGYLKRSGDWQLSVESMNSPWKLSASATDFVRNNEAGGNADVLDGGMVYVDPKDKNDVHALNVGANGTPVGITEQDTKDSKTTNIGGNWSDDDGILLDLNSASVKGSYSSTITWDLTDSI